jgi:hypothetical protein
MKPWDLIGWGLIGLVAWVLLRPPVLALRDLVWLEWMRWKHRAWQPQVGDVVLFESLLGWRKRAIIRVYEDGQVRVADKSLHGYSSGPADPGDLIFTGERTERPDDFWGEAWP